MQTITNSKTRAFFLFAQNGYSSSSDRDSDQDSLFSLQELRFDTRFDLFWSLLHVFVFENIIFTRRSKAKCDVFIHSMQQCLKA